MSGTAEFVVGGGDLLQLGGVAVGGLVEELAEEGDAPAAAGAGSAALGELAGDFRVLGAQEVRRACAG